MAASRKEQLTTSRLASPRLDWRSSWRRVRNWKGWHHYHILSLIASWFLVTENTGGKNWTPGTGRTPAITVEWQVELLQWGRVQSNAESTHRGTRSDAPNPLVASMGPRSIERGKATSTGWTAQNQLNASMGPRSIERGKRGVSGHLAKYRSASMGPRSIERGKDERRSRQCKRRPASMGPRSIERGKGSTKIRNEDLAERSGISFNGAAFNRTRKVLPDF